MDATSPQKRWLAWLGNGLFLATAVSGIAWATGGLWSPYPAPRPQGFHPAREGKTDMDDTVRAVDTAFQREWVQRGLKPAAPAPDLTVARRLSLALTGSVPSLQEIRALEAQPEAERTTWWLEHLLEDRRCSDYLAERLARACVGVEHGPFLVYRRRRLVQWLSDSLQQNRPYDETVRELIDSTGIWTTRPAVNFVTVTQEPKKGIDDAKLAARVTRAFLGVRIDCVQCHDGKLGSTWKQKDFHQLAAFFAPAQISFAGLRDNEKKGYKVRYLRDTVDELVPPAVPWAPQLEPETGPLRQRLAAWVTAPGNRAFARAIVNRVWALLFNRPLISPVDDIPLKGPLPPGLEILADDFTAHHCDLHRLIRVIVATRIFQLDSRSPDPNHPAGEADEKQWAVFPLTRLRPEQMAGSVIQAASLTTLDADAPVVFRVKEGIDETNFVKRYGDFGEDEFGNQSGTVPQRLLLMNGEMVHNHAGVNLLVNASSRIALLAPDDATAVETAYLCAFCRRPTAEEAEYFTSRLSHAKGRRRLEAMSELYWTLFNATEFSWNH